MKPPVAVPPKLVDEDEEVIGDDSPNVGEEEANGGEEEMLSHPVGKRVAKTHGASSGSKPILAPYKPRAPYPNRLDEDSRAKSFAQFFEMLRGVRLTLPFTEAIAKMPMYARFLKEIFTNKRKLTEAANVTLNEQCSAIVSTFIPTKLKDPGSFHIPCRIGELDIEKGLADLGASINVMPYSVYRALDLNKLKPTRMRIQLADKSLKYPRGVVEDVFVRIGNFVFLVDFVVVDTGDTDLSLILGRPFLNTSKAIIDVFEGTLTLRVDKEHATFNLTKTMQFSHAQDDIDFDEVEFEDVDVIASVFQVNG